MSERTEQAIFAAGCFWGVEASFLKLEGVVDAESGYTGGETRNPSYKQVCTGGTGHAEGVRVTFDPDTITYDQLLEAFWDMHNPTTLNRQGPDVGTQYRSAIFYLDEDQKKAAERSKEDAQRRFDRPIVTQIADASEFFRAEEYHQRYYEKNGIAHC